jgi:hypothetical protein
LAYSAKFGQIEQLISDARQLIVVSVNVGHRRSFVFKGTRSDCRDRDSSCTGEVTFVKEGKEPRKSRL